VQLPMASQFRSALLVLLVLSLAVYDRDGGHGFAEAATGAAAGAAGSSGRPTSMRRVHFYTFTDTIPHPGTCALAEATAELGGVLRIIGLSKRPGYILIHSHSPTLKFLMLQEVIEYELNEGRIAKDDLMIFADGHDVLLQRPLAEIVAAYERWPGSPYLISGEKNCWPWPHTDPSHGKWDPGMAVAPNTTFPVHKWLQISASEFCRAIPEKGPYRYPNIGLSMGPVHRFLEVLKRNNRIVLDEDVNDQGAMWLVIIRHALELNMEIDQNAEVFLNMLQYEQGDLAREPCVANFFAERNVAIPAAPPALAEAEAFVLTGLLRYCPAGADLTDADICRMAASSLGIRWGGSYEGPGDHHFCLHADDGRDAVYFNAAGERAAVLPQNGFYGSLCRKVPASGGSERLRAPPLNLLTNFTPGFLHFNGPSHEDDTWVACYHAWVEEFRVSGKGHVFFDVDHNIVLSTDDICDYSWYRIRDFHAHPVHGGVLDFLKDFYKLPVDPGLLAWRGSTSAVDAVKLGREEDLHSSSERLQEALLERSSAPV